MTNSQYILILFPILFLSCTLTAQPSFKDKAKVPVPSEQQETSQPTATQVICSVKTGFTAGALNLRVCAGTNCQVIATLHESEFLILKQQKEDSSWIEITTKSGISGWLNSRYTTCEVTK